MVRYRNIRIRNNAMLGKHRAHLENHVFRMQFCHSIGGHLATFDDNKKQRKFLSSLLGDKKVWLGYCPNF